MQGVIVEKRTHGKHANDLLITSFGYCSGELVNNEKKGFREISIFKPELLYKKMVVVGCRLRQYSIKPALYIGNTDYKGYKAACYLFQLRNIMQKEL